MDPKPTSGLLMAPGRGSGAAVRLPARDPGPSLDEHVVQPEVSRDELIRGRRIVALPATPPHADRQHRLDYVVGAHIKPGFVGSTELLTRVGEGSDFATDVCVRREGTDPQTGKRYLEELAFEVVNEQSLRDVTEKAEDLTARGVRRVVALFVKTGRVGVWSASRRGWDELPLDGTLDDPCLSRPLRVRALVEAAEADDEVARALVGKGNRVIAAVKAEGFDAGVKKGEELGLRRGEGKGKAAAILAFLGARGLAVSDAVRARILACEDEAVLDRWIVQAATVADAEALLG